MEKEKTILNGNMLIAEFMDKTVYPMKGSVDFSLWKGKPCDYHQHDLRYHLQWDMLMPVIEKICKLKIGDGDEYVEYACPRTFGMLDKNGLFMFRFNGFQLHSCETLIEAAWFGVIDFIEWYNTNVK